MHTKRFLVLITSALLLSASLFLAPAAFAEHQEGHVADTCDKVLDGSIKPANSPQPVVLDGGGSLTWSGTTLNYVVPEGKTLVVCIKAGSEQSDGGTHIYPPIVGPASGSLSTVGILDGHDISHISYIYTDTPPDTTATASIGDVACEDTSVDLTLGSSGTSDFTATVDGTAVSASYTGVTGSGNTETLDLSSLADGNYTVRVASADLAADVTKAITIDSECEQLVVASATVTGNCDDGATVELTGNEGDEFTVTVGDATENVTLDSTGEWSKSYTLPTDALTTVTVGGAATKVSTFDCELEVQDTVNEKPREPSAPTDPVDPDQKVDVEEEVEVLPQVIERDELSATGDFEDRLLVIALALMGLGLPLTLVKPRWQQINSR